MNDLKKQEWVLLLLNLAPLDRIRLMKALFLIWHRSGRQIPNYFEFEPYMYGPCSFELYPVLEDLQRDHLISQAPHPVMQWSPYYLTPRGAALASTLRMRLDQQTVARVEQVASEVSGLGFNGLLEKVYTEAPEFASKSVMTNRRTNR